MNKAKESQSMINARASVFGVRKFIVNNNLSGLANCLVNAQYVRMTEENCQKPVSGDVGKRFLVHFIRVVDVSMLEH